MNKNIDGNLAIRFVQVKILSDQLLVCIVLTPPSSITSAWGGAKKLPGYSKTFAN